MFKIFGQAKESGQQEDPPGALSYPLSERQQEAFNSLRTDPDGFVPIGDVTHGLLFQQPQYVSRYIDGSNPSVPVLVEDLRVKTEGFSYHDYAIHRDDVLEFLARVKAHR